MRDKIKNSENASDRNDQNENMERQNPESFHAEERMELGDRQKREGRNDSPMDEQGRRREQDQSFGRSGMNEGGNAELRNKKTEAGTEEGRKPRRGSGRGFASMNPEEVREIASMGGRAAHASGKAHEFTSAEARKAARERWR